MLKLLQTAEVLSSLLISFIETPGPPPLGFPWHVRPAVTQARLSLIPSLQEGVPTALPQQLITQKLLRGIRRVWRKMRRWADRSRSVTLTQFPPFPVAPLMLTHFCSVNPQVHRPCLVHWVTACPKHNSASRTYVLRKLPCGTHSSHSWENYTNS